jgi:hypothetical protein
MIERSHARAAFEQPATASLDEEACPADVKAADPPQRYD